MHFSFLFEYSVGRVDKSVGHFDDSVGCVDNSICRVCGIGYGVFVLILIESIGDVVMLVMFVPIGVESKGGRLIEIKEETFRSIIVAARKVSRYYKLPGR